MHSLVDPRLRYEEVINQGKIAHAEKRYEEAMQYFDVALGKLSVKSPLDQKMAVFDLQCSTLVKLKRLKDALNVSKSMIRLNKQNARGYLRASSIAKATDDLQLAVQFLDHGFDRVPKSDILYANLAAQRKEMQSKTIEVAFAAKATDPMKVLPLEILHMMLRLLDYAQIVSMLRVCRAWKRVLSCLEPLIDTIDLRGSRRQPQVSQLALKTCMSRVSNARTLALQNMSPPAANMMKQELAIRTKWVALEHLILNDFRMKLHHVRFENLNLKSVQIGLENTVAFDQVCYVLSTCHSLESASFQRVQNVRRGEPDMVAERPKLISLELGNAFDLAAFPIVPGWFTSFPNLEKLTVSGAALSTDAGWDLRANAKLVKLDTYASVIRSIYLPTSLETWLWDGTLVPCFSLSRCLRTAPDPLPNLHTVCFSGDNSIEALKLLRKCQVAPGQIKRAGLHNRQQAATLTAENDFVEPLSKVKNFSFESESLVDMHALVFAMRYPDVEVLQLAAPRITGAFIADMLRRKENQIRQLVLKGCENVSHDTIDWARARGVQVIVHRGLVEVRGGRRMREGFFDS